MGMQGPLTAQALGRSPYDDVAEGEGPEDIHQPAQQYDHRGRPVNPDTKRINRDFIRAHNEVMLVIGVAEPDNHHALSESESQRRHQAYEEFIGIRLGFSAKTCVESVGIFGINGLRQRILIYKRYSQIPFWELFRQARADFSFSRDVFAGAPASLAFFYLDDMVRKLWPDEDKEVASCIVQKTWLYLRAHVQVFIVLQRLGFISANVWFPGPSFFIPFTEASPIAAPPLPRDCTIPSLLSWLGGALISSTPFLVFVMTERVMREVRSQIWTKIYRRLPSTSFYRKPILPPPPPPALPSPTPPPPPPPPPPHTIASSSTASPHPSNSTSESGRQEPESSDRSLFNGNNIFRDNTEAGPSSQPSQETPGRESVLSARGDEYPTDDEENEGVSATLISFDVEASESHDAPPGLWSAELRPSAGPDTRSPKQQPVYMDTFLTRLPSLIATHLLTNSAIRILLAPYEATTLRLIARFSCLSQGLPCDVIFTGSLLSGLTRTWFVNFLGTELLNLALCSEVWAAFTLIFQRYHMTEEEWKDEEEESNDSS
ncbi:hypothetical protein E4U31_003504 [Claviceps sp. LM219 group G6]|nr:hypothetical protein E4U31_003504 [Claviceps sp. LM219 group G6]